MRLAIILSLLTIGTAAPAAPDAHVVPPAPKEFRLVGDAKRGEAIYTPLCASCHGKTGDGRGIIGKALTPPPRDFTDPKHMAAMSDWELFLAVSSGGTSVGLSATMPAWSSTLKEQDIHDVVVFVKTFCEKKKGSAK